MSLRTGKLIGIGLLIMLGLFLVYKFFFPPQALSYLSLTQDTKSTADKVTDAECSDITLRVTETDTVTRGTVGTIDIPGRAPELIDVYIFEGFRDSERIFTVADTPQNWGVPEKYRDSNARWLFEVPPTLKNSFITDQVAYDRARLEDRSGEVMTLVLSPDLPEQLVKDFAGCYSVNRERLQSALNFKISAFVMPFPTQAHLVPSK